MVTFRAAGLLSTLLIFASSAPGAETLKFVWNNYCPFTCETEKSGQPGYAMEVVKAIFDDSPYQVQYNFMLSWNRALSQVKSGEKDAMVFSFYDSSERRFYVIPGEPLVVENTTSFVVRKNNLWQFDRVDSLAALKFIGVYKGTVWDDGKIARFEQNNPAKFIYLHGDNIVNRAFEMVRRGRIDAWEDSRVLLNYHIFRNEVNDLRIESLPKPQRQTGDILFSRRNSKSGEYAAFFSDGMERLRKTGRLQEILSRYGLVDWQGSERAAGQAVSVDLR